MMDVFPVKIEEHPLATALIRIAEIVADATEQDKGKEHPFMKTLLLIAEIIADATKRAEQNDYIKTTYPLKSIFECALKCTQCDWVGTVGECGDEEHDDGQLDCPRCHSIAKEDLE